MSIDSIKIKQAAKMKKVIVLLQMLLIISLSENTKAQIDTLRIFHLNDTHSCLAPLGPRNEFLQGTQGGIARAASVIGYSKATQKNVLALHAGDLSIGDPFFNNFLIIPELQILQLIGLDAVTIGNHEFDLTPNALLSSLSCLEPDCSLSILSCNLIIEAPELQDLRQIIRGCTIKELEDFKVGIFGLTPPETNYFSLPAPVVVDTNIVDLTLQIVDSLKSEGCDFIICLSHLGFALDQILAENIPYINLIVGGHDHYELPEPVEIQNPLGSSTYIVQAGAFYRFVGEVNFIKTGEDISLLNGRLIPLNSDIPEDFSVKMNVDDLVLTVEQTFPGMYSQQISTTESFFEEFVELPLSVGNKDTPVGNLITDAYRIFTHTCGAVSVSGATAQPLYNGPIVPADVYRMISYGFNEDDLLDFRLATFDITSFELAKAFNIVLSMIDLNDEFLPQVSGLTIEYDISKSPENRLTKLELNGLPILPEQVVKLTTNEALLLALTDVLGVTVSNVFIYENDCEYSVVINYLESNGTIIPKIEGRVKAVDGTVKVADNEYVIYDFILNQNYPNPFNPSTTITYQIAEEGNVTLKIFDILGREISTLVNDFQKPGEYKIKFANNINLASGVYFYQLKMKNKVISKKMMILE
ncbi:MAG: hypothetical protein CMF23_01335 [Ignavibacteriae bacterium]|nr:hypothetical protein [Ignavibacteriota bacterium]